MFLKLSVNLARWLWQCGQKGPAGGREGSGATSGLGCRESCESVVEDAFSMPGIISWVGLLHFNSVHTLTTSYQELKGQRSELFKEWRQSYQVKPTNTAWEGPLRSFLTAVTLVTDCVHTQRLPKRISILSTGLSWDILSTGGRDFGFNYSNFSITEHWGRYVSVI